MNSTVLPPIGSAQSEYAGTWIHETPSSHAASTVRAPRRRPRSGSIVRSPPGSTSTTIVPVARRAAHARRRPAARSAARRLADTVVTDPADEPHRTAGQGSGCGDVGAATASRAGDHGRRVGAPCRRAGEAHDDVLDQVTDHAQHGHRLPRDRTGSMEPWPTTNALPQRSCGPSGCSSSPAPRRRRASAGAPTGSAACSATTADASCCSPSPTRCCARPTRDARWPSSATSSAPGSRPRCPHRTERRCGSPRWRHRRHPVRWRRSSGGASAPRRAA